MKNKEKRNEQIIDAYDYIGNSGSQSDCTGLIPAAIQDESELDSYEDIYHFSVPKSKQDLAADQNMNRAH